MSRDDLPIPDPDQIDAALDEIINLPLADLLNIAEFVDKIDDAPSARPGIERWDELPKAA